MAGSVANYWCSLSIGVYIMGEFIALLTGIYLTWFWMTCGEDIKAAYHEQITDPIVNFITEIILIWRTPIKSRSVDGYDAILPITMTLGSIFYLKYKERQRRKLVNEKIRPLDNLEYPLYYYNVK